ATGRAARESVAGHKNQAHRLRNSCDLADSRQLPGTGVNRELHNISALLVRNQQVGPFRINRKIARDLAAARYSLSEGKFAGGTINREHRNAVVTAVRGVEKLPAGMNRNFGGIALS